MTAKLIRGIDNLPIQHGPSVVSIGNYDGVHLGHQHVVATLVAKSRELDLPSTVVTFEPLAKEFFMPSSVPRLMSIEQRALMLSKLGVDHVLCIEFNEEVANSSPTLFVENVLIDGLGAQYISVGDDFRFGKNRAGDFSFLEKMGKQNGFAVVSHETFELNGERVSSGRVRKALQQLDFEQVEHLLGRPYSIEGFVSRGKQLGRALNFPTANINLASYALALTGVFVVRCFLGQSNKAIYGVDNLGNRPTVDGTNNCLEVHLFDFDADIYDEFIIVEFLHKIRSERKFASVEQLQQQIRQDVSKAKEYCQQI